jgi:L-fuconolactonase
MVTEADWEKWEPQDLKPYVDWVLELLGEDRVMFGSDWPVCLLASDYATVKGTLESLLGNPEGETYTKIFGGNATQFYRL